MGSPVVLTDRLIEQRLSLRRTQDRLEMVDGAEPGLRLRAGPAATEWSVLTPDGDGRKVRVPLGSWPEVPPAQARVRAAEAKKLQRQNAGRAGSRVRIESLLERYRTVRLSQLRSGAATYRSLRAGLTDLLQHDVRAIDRRQISAAIGSIAATAPIHANRTLAYIRAFFGWVVAEGHLDVNPAAPVRKPARERARERTPSLEEVVQIWAAAGELGYPYGPIVRLLILTAARRSEVGSMRRQELHLLSGSSAGVWTIPATRSKNRRAIRVPLSSLARQAIEEALEQGTHARSELVFTTTGLTPVSGWSKIKERLDRIIAGADGKYAIEPWVLHDLRRTFATVASEVLHVPHEVTDRCLNHVGAATTSTVSRAYQRSELFDQRREALERWSVLVAEAVEAGARKINGEALIYPSS